jgi:hypothetical protein
LPFEHLDPVDVAFDLAGAVGQGTSLGAAGIKLIVGVLSAAFQMWDSFSV